MVLESPHQHTVIPVFCDVEPDDLRYIDKGRYAAAFKAHEVEAREEAYGKAADQVTMEVGNRLKLTEVEAWKDALGKAADIPGYLFKTEESDYGEILEKIEENVLKEFRKSCYLSTNREEVDIRCLQRQLLHDLLGIDEFIGNIKEGKRILRDHLAGLQILLVLDGFDHIE